MTKEGSCAGEAVAGAVGLGKVGADGVQATAKAKYRGLSTAAAKAPPSVEMTWVKGRASD